MYLGITEQGQFSSDVDDIIVCSSGMDVHVIFASPGDSHSCHNALHSIVEGE